jgi:hypothetical protein
MGTFYATIDGRDVETGDSWIVQDRVEEIAFGPNQEVATLVVETDDGLVDVGGQVAVYENIEVHEIQIFRDPAMLTCSIRVTRVLEG